MFYNSPFRAQDFNTGKEEGDGDGSLKSVGIGCYKSKPWVLSLLRLFLRYFILVSVVFIATSKRVRGEVKPTLRRRTSTRSRYSSTNRRASTAHDVHMAMLPDLSGMSDDPWVPV